MSAKHSLAILPAYARKVWVKSMYRDIRVLRKHPYSFTLAFYIRQNNDKVSCFDKLQELYSYNVFARDKYENLNWAYQRMTPTQFSRYVSYSGNFIPF